jgi:hypothetical protein
LLLSDSEFICANGWTLLRFVPTPADVVVDVWQQVLRSDVTSTSLRVALNNPGAVEMLVQSGSPTLHDRIAAAIDSVSRLFSSETFAIWVTGAPIDSVVTAVTRLPRDAWQASRAWFPALQKAGRLGAFWRTMGELIERGELSTPNGQAFIQASSYGFIYNTPDIAVLEIRSPLFEEVLVRWAQQHQQVFRAGTAELYSVATHPLRSLRTWGLSRARAVGIDMPFALRLLESQLPEAVDLGQEVFEALPPGDVRELEWALALCDSPTRSVQAYGRAYAHARLATLPIGELVTHLEENQDPVVQAFVAERLLGEANGAVQHQEFDRRVLCTRDRARRAKELVKRRVAAEGSVDDATLLELARSGTSRDAEWALGELARRAIMGAPTPDVRVEGVAGI